MAMKAKLQDCLHAWFILDGYLWDWITAVVLIIIHETVPGAFHTRDRYYTSGDPTLSYPVVPNTIPGYSMYCMVFGIPGLSFLTYAVFKRQAADLHHAALSLVEAFALATGWKRWISLVGRLRPSWFATLALHDSAKERDAREAYPSGHAAYMFFGMTLLSCWMLGKMNLLSRPSQGLFLKVVLALSPLWLAQYVAVTRLADYRHDFSDVNAGIFIGVCSGLIAYFINYPSLLARDSHLPKLRSIPSPLYCTLSQLGGPHTALWPSHSIPPPDDLHTPAAAGSSTHLQQPLSQA